MTISHLALLKSVTSLSDAFTTSASGRGRARGEAKEMRDSATIFTKKIIAHVMNRMNSGSVSRIHKKYRIAKRLKFI